MPPRQRATLVLRFYCDLNVEQAAQVLGCSPGTVKSQTVKGLAALRRALDPDRIPARSPPAKGNPVMDEPQVRAIFERLSGTEAPPSQVDVGLARLPAAGRLRRRRAVLSGTPAVAVAVVALSASGIVASRRRAARAAPERPPGNRCPAARHRASSARSSPTRSSAGCPRACR